MISKIITASLGMAMMVGAAIGIANVNATEVNAEPIHQFVPFTGDVSTIEEDNTYMITYGSYTLGNSMPNGFYEVNYGSSGNWNGNRVYCADRASIHRLIPLGDNLFNIYNPDANKYIGTRSSLTGMYLYDSGTVDSAQWTIIKKTTQDGVFYEFENLGKLNSGDVDRRANRYLRNSSTNNRWVVGKEDEEGRPVKIFVETQIDHIRAYAPRTQELVGKTYATNEFSVDVYWVGGGIMTVTSEYTWTVNGVTKGAIQAGANTIIVYYNNVASNSMTVYGLQPATAVVLSDNEATCYAPGETYQLTATIEPADSTDTTVAWESLDPDIATVDNNGLVTAVAPGTARIKASAGSVSSQCNVTVCDYETIEFNLKDNNAYSVAQPTDDSVAQAALNGYTFNFKNSHNNDGTNANGLAMKTNGSLLSNSTAIPGAIVRVTYFVAAYSNYGQVDYRVVCSNNEITDCATEGGETFNGKIRYSVNYDIANNYHFFGISNNNVTYTGLVEGIKVFYEPSTIKEEIRQLQTQTSLAYRYQKDNEGNFTYSDMSIRFGAVVSKATWNELDFLYGITGFGVMISSGDYVRDYQDFDEFASAAIEPGENVYTDINNKVVDYFVPIADMNEIIGVDGDNYFWNLRWSVDSSDMDKVFSAAPYIKVGDEYVFLKKERTCVTYVAIDYIVNRGYSAETAGGSLQNIVNQSQFE